MDVTITGIPAYKGKEPYIFVSYAHRDAELVYDIIEKIDLSGFRVWYDEGIDPGNEWGREIANAILGCKVFIVFISNQSIASDNVLDEINMASEEGKIIAPIYIEDVVLPPELKLKLSRKQAIMQFRMNEENFLRKLTYLLNSHFENDLHMASESNLMKKPPIEVKASKEHKSNKRVVIAVAVLGIMGIAAIGYALGSKGYSEKEVQKVADNQSTPSVVENNASAAPAESAAVAAVNTPAATTSGEAKTTAVTPTLTPATAKTQVTATTETKAAAPTTTAAKASTSTAVKTTTAQTTTQTATTQASKTTSTTPPEETDDRWNGPTDLIIFHQGTRETFEPELVSGDTAHVMPWGITQKPGSSLATFSTTFVRSKLPSYLKQIDQVSVTGSSLSFDEFYTFLTNAIEQGRGLSTFSVEETAYVMKSDAGYYNQHYVSLMEKGQIKAIIGIKIDGSVHVKLY